MHAKNRVRYIPPDEQAHLISKLFNSGIAEANIAHHLGISRKTLRTFFPGELLSRPYWGKRRGGTSIIFNGREETASSQSLAAAA